MVEGESTCLRGLAQQASTAQLGSSLGSKTATTHTRTDGADVRCLFGMLVSWLSRLSCRCDAPGRSLCGECRWMCAWPRAMSIPPRSIPNRDVPGISAGEYCVGNCVGGEAAA